MSGLLNPKAIETLPAVKAYLEHADATRRIMDENYGNVTDFTKRLELAVEENVLVQLENLRTCGRASQGGEKRCGDSERRADHQFGLRHTDCYLSHCICLPQP